MIKLPNRSLFPTALLLLAISGPAASADDADHERAHRALQGGEIKPLSEILDAVEHRFVGDVLDVELESENGGYVYELKILSPDGRLSEIYIDALTAEVLSGEYD